MRFAVFGDIHGNIFGLQAVLADLRRHRPDAMIVTGDLVYKLPWGAEVVDLLRSLPHWAVLGNSELYLALWETSLWPAEQWNLPLAHEMVSWERARLGAERLAWLATLPEYVALSAGRVEDLLVVHGAPGNPFLPLLARPGEDRSPWVQTDARVQELLGEVDADVVVCGHTHTAMIRRAASRVRPDVLIVNPGSLSYGRGRDAVVGRAGYALLDWSARTGWQATLHTVEYDPAPLHAALLALRGDYPVAGYVANRMRPPGAATVPEQRLDFIRFRWGDAPEWWERRDELAAWRALRGDGVSA
ncbi:MAG: metallophosphoesterase family protein [Anaerolineae bacterium]